MLDGEQRSRLRGQPVAHIELMTPPILITGSGDKVPDCMIDPPITRVDVGPKPLGVEHNNLARLGRRSTSWDKGSPALR